MTNYSKFVIKMLVAALIISTSSVWVKTSQVDPSVSGFYRMFIGGLVLITYSGFKRIDLWRGWRYFSWLFLAALFFAIDLYFWHRSIFYIGPGLATLLGNFQVFMMAFAGYLFFQERIGLKFIFGLIITLFGLFLLVGINWSELSEQYKTGVIFGLLTAVAYTEFMLSLRHVQVQARENKLSAVANLGILSLACSVILFIQLKVDGLTIDIPTTQSLVSLLILGIFCQVIGWLLITHAMPNLPASIVGVLLLLQPALSMLWDVLFFNRSTDLLDLIGLTMVLGGVYFATVKAK